MKHILVVGEVHFGYPNLYSNAQSHKKCLTGVHETTVKGTESRDYTGNGYYLLKNPERFGKLSKL